MERITYREAARRLGVGEATARTLLRHGVLEQTPPPADGSRRVKAHASIHVDSLDRARAWLVQREADRAERERRREQHGNPPDYDHVWLDTAVVAAMVGLTVKWVQWRIREGRMPATFHGGQYWVRREHAEVIVAARAFAGRQGDRSQLASLLTGFAGGETAIAKVRSVDVADPGSRSTPAH